MFEKYDAVFEGTCNRCGRKVSMTGREIDRPHMTCYLDFCVRNGAMIVVPCTCGPNIGIVVTEKSSASPCKSKKSRHIKPAEKDLIDLIFKLEHERNLE